MPGWRSPWLRLAGLLVLWVSLSGCSLILLGMAGGDGEDLDLDGDQTHRADIEVGESLTLEMRDPKSGGYEVVGAYFDTDLLDLESFIVEPGDPDEDDRLEYRFLAKAQGDAMIEMRVRPLDSPEALPEVYKRVLVIIEPD